MENAMLTFDNVSAHYGKIQALHNVSLHIMHIFSPSVSAP